MNNIINISVEQEFLTRKRLYENKDVFTDIAGDAEGDIGNETDKNKLDPEIENINKAVSSGKKMLLENLDIYNSGIANILKINESMINSNETFFAIDNKLEYIKKICVDKDLDIEHGVDNIIDQINYLLFSLKENMIVSFTEKRRVHEENIQKSKTTLQALAKTYNIINNTNISYTCPICMVDQVDTYCNPCGHALCTRCISKSNNCYFCKSRIISKQKIYFLL
jgi:hypothetical protein